MIRRARAWLRERPWTKVLVVVVLVASPGYFRLEQAVDRSASASSTAKSSAAQSAEAAEAAEAVALGLAAEAARADKVACERQRDTIIAVRGLVELTRDQGGGLRLTAVPGFADLSVEMQRYLRNLEAASSAGEPGEGGSFADRALELLVIPECG